MSTPQTFRKDRKVIEEGKEQKDNLSAQEALNDSISGLSDTTKQGSDSIADAIWTTGEMTVDGVSDVAAGTELVAENTEETNQHLKQLNQIQRSISKKLNTFSDMLRANLRGVSAPVLQPGTDVETEVEKQLPETPVEDKPVVLPELYPEPTRPEDKFNPDSEKEKAQSGKIDEILHQLTTLNKSVAGGFSKSLAFSDKISSMLFKYTISAVANAAKTAAIILSIIMAIDILVANFQYWRDEFSKGVAKFEDKFKEFAEPLKTLLTSVDKFITEMNNGEYAKALGTALGGALNFADELAGAITYALGNLLTQYLRAQGKGDIADKLMVMNAEYYNQVSGHELNDLELDASARVRKKEHDKETSTGKLEVNVPDKQLASLRALKYGGNKTEEQQEAFKSELEEIEYQKANPKSEEQKLQLARTEAKIQSTLNSVKRDAERFSQNPEELARIETKLNDAETALNSDRQPKRVKESLQAQIDENKALINKYKKPTIAPAPVAESEISRQADKVEKLDQPKPAPETKPGESQVQVNNVKSVKNTTVHVSAPVTSFTAPGLASSRTV